MQNVISGGSERWPAKVPVLLRTVSGHRDTGFTECPGGTLYARLNQIAADAAKLGGPKIFDPRVEASAEGPVRFRARLSQALSWTVTVTSAGAEVARSAGSGKTLDWTWDATSLQPGPYRWSISAGSARPATGYCSRRARDSETGTAIAISEASVTPGGITPNGDGQGDVADISFSLSAPANVTVEVADAAGTVVATVLDRAWQAAGEYTIAVDGAALSDGAYTVNVRGGQRPRPRRWSRRCRSSSAARSASSPRARARSRPTATAATTSSKIGSTLTVPASVTVRIVREGRWVASPALGASFVAGEHRIVWDGSQSEGRLRDGTYEAVVEVTDVTGTVSFGTPLGCI